MLGVRRVTVAGTQESIPCASLPFVSVSPRIPKSDTDRTECPLAYAMRILQGRQSIARRGVWIDGRAQRGYNAGARRIIDGGMPAHMWPLATASRLYTRPGDPRWHCLVGLLAYCRG